MPDGASAGKRKTWILSTAENRMPTKSRPAARAWSSSASAHALAHASRGDAAGALLVHGVRGVHAGDDGPLARGLLALAVVEHQLPRGVACGEHRPQFGHAQVGQLGGQDAGEVVAEGDADELAGGVLHLAGALALGHPAEAPDQLGPPGEPPGAQPLGEPDPLVVRQPFELTGADAPRSHQRGLLPHGRGSPRHRVPGGDAQRGCGLRQRPRGVLGGLARGGPRGLRGRDRPPYGTDGRRRHRARAVGGVRGTAERLPHGARRAPGGLLCRLRPLGPALALPAVRQHPAQLSRLGEDGHGGGIGVARGLPVQCDEVRRLRQRGHDVVVGQARGGHLRGRAQPRRDVAGREEDIAQEVGGVPVVRAELRVQLAQSRGPRPCVAPGDPVEGVGDHGRGVPLGGRGGQAEPVTAPVREVGQLHGFPPARRTASAPVRRTASAPGRFTASPGPCSRRPRGPR